MLRIATIAALVFASSIAAADAKLDVKDLSAVRIAPSATKTEPAGNARDAKLAVESVASRIKAAAAQDDDKDRMRTRLLHPDAWLAHAKR